MRNLTRFASSRYRSEIRNYYLEMAFNAFLSKYEWEGLSARQVAYLMRKAWGEGTWALFPIGNEEVGEFAVSGYAAESWDSYNYPVKISILNERNNPLYPSTAINGENAVVGWAQYDKKPLSGFVMTLVNNIVDVECIIKCHEFAQKVGLLVKCSPETEAALRELIRKVENDEPVLYVKEEELNAISALINGVPYNLDKLYNYLQSRIDALKTFLGIDNSPMMDFDRMNVDQTNANNAEIDNAQDNFLDNFKAFAKECEEVLGIKITPKAKQKRVTSMHDDVREENEDEKDI